MSCWNVIGIARTCDISAIRKAYARRLRQCHPEEDPVGYQRLREAYEEALSIAKLSDDFDFSDEICDKRYAGAQEHPWSGENRMDTECETRFDEGLDEVPQVDEEDDLSFIENDSDIDAFIKEAEALYSDFSQRVKKEKWEELFTAEVLWDLEKKEYLDWRMMGFLREHFFFPHTIWQILDEKLHLTVQSDRLYTYYSEDFAEYILQQIEPGMPFQYKGLSVNESVEIESYLEIRERILWELHQGNFLEAKKLINCATEMALEDPDLLLLQGEYELRVGRSITGFDMIGRYKEKCQNHLDGLTYSIRLLMDTKNHEEALALCNEILQSSPKCTLGWVFKGDLFARKRKQKESLTMYLEAIKCDSSNREARSRLMKRWSALQNKLYEQPWNPQIMKSLMRIQSEAVCVQGFPHGIRKPKYMDWIKSVGRQSFTFTVLGIILYSVVKGSLVGLFLVGIYVYYLFKRLTGVVEPEEDM